MIGKLREILSNLSKQEDPLTLDEVKEQILSMESGDKRSFPVDKIPEDQEFDNFTGWLVINKGAGFIGRDYKRMRLDIKLY